MKNYGENMEKQGNTIVTTITTPEPKSVVKEALQLTIQSSQAWGCYYIYEQ